MKNLNDNFYTTSDLALIVTLSLFFPVESVEKDESGKAYFSFEQSKKLNKIIDSFYRDELQVSPQKFFNQIKTIKSRIYSII